MSKTIKPLFFTWEDTSGTVNGPVRIFATDKIGAESTCRKQRWDYADTPRVHCLMGFYAARRNGATGAQNFDEFMATLVDFNISNTESDDDEDQEPDADPMAAGSDY